jgi:cbb3-type cytochrome oxidase subunit 1
MSAATIETPVYDRTARKAHQWSVVALIAAGFILQGVPAALLLAVAGLIMLVGRFWWPADVVRQLVWRVLEPAGVLKRDDVHEDHETRRVARIMGGTIWLVGAVLLVAGNPVIAWVISVPIAVMIALDASVDFCALCFVLAQLDRRGILRRA